MQKHSKQKEYQPVVQISAGKNMDTGFLGFSVFESDKPTEEDPWPDAREEKSFLIRPSPSGRLIIMCYDKNSDRSLVPCIQPEIIGDYIHPYHARRRLEKEALAYSRELMKRWGAKLLTDSGLKSLDELERI